MDQLKKMLVYFSIPHALTHILAQSKRNLALLIVQFCVKVPQYLTNKAGHPGQKYASVQIPSSLPKHAALTL